MEIDIENNGATMVVIGLVIIAIIITYTEASMKGVIILAATLGLAYILYKAAMKVGMIGDMKHTITRIKNYNLKKRIRTPKLREMKYGEKKKEKWNIHW